MGGQLGFGFGMVEVVADVGEEGLCGLELLDDGDGLGEVCVAGVWLAAEGVEDEDVESAQEAQGVVAEVAHVGEVGGCAEAVAGDLLAAVDDGDAAEAGTEEGDGGAGGLVDAVEADAGAGGIAVEGAEGVVEDALDGVGGGGVGVEGEGVGVFEAEGAEVVEAEDVVGVRVGVEDGVDAGEVLAECLRVEVGAGVDEDGFVLVLDENGGAGAAVMGVGGGADRAIAAQGGHAHGRAAAEEGEGGRVGGDRHGGSDSLISFELWAEDGTEYAAAQAARPVFLNEHGPCDWFLADDAGAASGRGWTEASGGLLLLGGGGAGEGLGDLEEGEMEFEEGAVEEGGLGAGAVAFGLVLEDIEHFDGLLGSHEIDLGLLALGGGSAELHDGGHVDGLDDALEGGGWGVLHAGVGRAYGDRQALGGLGVGQAGVLNLLGGGAGGEVLVLLFRILVEDLFGWLYRDRAGGGGDGRLFDGA